MGTPILSALIALVVVDAAASTTPLIPRSQQQINAELARIAKTRIEWRDKRPGYGYPAVLQNLADKKKQAEIESAVRQLMQYRYLCGVPYEGIWLDGAMAVEATAAADVCSRLGKITHDPTNPDMPEAEFRIGETGCSKCNLGMGTSAVGSVHMYMHDSDQSNVSRVGHRRWCLNPAMQRVGFGRVGEFSAMHCMDSSREEVPDWDMIAYPPRGYMPRTYIQPTSAWSVQMNPEKFKVEKDAIKIVVTPAHYLAAMGRARLEGQPLALDYSNVVNDSFGAGPAIISGQKACKRRLATRTPSRLPG